MCRMQPPRNLLLLCRRLVAVQPQCLSCSTSSACFSSETSFGVSTHQQPSLVSQHRQFAGACTEVLSSRQQQGLAACQIQLQQQLSYLHSLHNGSHSYSKHHLHSSLRFSSSTSSTASHSTGAQTPDSGGTSSTAGSSTDDTAAAASSSQEAKLQIPPVLTSAAAGAGAAAVSAGKATAKQVSKLLKLIQQTSVLQAAHLQLSSVWQSHSTAITMLVAAAATAGLSQGTIAAAGLFTDNSSTEALLTCTAVSAAAVGGAGLYLRSGLVVNPERVYEVALRKLTNHAGLQEVMGTPLAGSAMRVQLVTRGSYFVQESLLPKRRAPRIHMLFPLTGPLGSGVVSLEAKKLANGKYAYKTLLVELPNRALTGAMGVAAAAEAAARAKEQFANAARTSAGAEAAVQPDAAANADQFHNSASIRVDEVLQDPARIYIIGEEQATSQHISSSSSSTSAMQQPVPSARALLEQLKHPLMLALQQNTVVYEAEDELEDLQTYIVLQSDPEQLTVIDRAKRGLYVALERSVRYGKVAGCNLVGLMRTGLTALKQKGTAKQPMVHATSVSSGEGVAATVPANTRLPVTESTAATAAPVTMSKHAAQPPGS